MRGVDHRSALVTGAAQGLGRAIALKLARAGAFVGVVDRQHGKAEAVVAEIQRAGGQALAVPADLSNPGTHDLLLRALDTSPFGPASILVNNAGIQRQAPFVDTKAADLDALIHLHLRGTFLLTRAVARRWVDDRVGGRVVNIASIAGAVHFSGFAAYSMTKVAVRAMTGALALELAPFGIRVNAVAPGHVETEMDSTRHNPAARIARIATIPRGRLATPDDIAQAVAFLASDLSAYITGQTIVVDGGVTLQ